MGLRRRMNAMDARMGEGRGQEGPEAFAGNVADGGKRIRNAVRFVG